MPMYNLIEYNNNYSKTSGSLCQYYRDETALTDAGASADFSTADNSALFKFKQVHQLLMIEKMLKQMYP